jgi:TRAP-type transport system small permease protein
MPLRLFDKLDQILTAAMKWICVCSLIGLLLLVGAGVFVRFVPVSSMGWADEIIELGFAWLVFIGAALLWRNRTHFRVDLLQQLVAGTRYDLGLQLAVQFISLLFFVIVAYEGAALTVAAVDTTPILEFPKSLWYMVIPISALIIIGYTARDIWWLLFRGHLKELNSSPDVAVCKPGVES